VVIRLVGGFHEFGELQVDAHDVRPKLLHFLKIFFHGSPLVVPVVFDQPPAAFLVIVVEAPGDELSS